MLGVQGRDTAEMLEYARRADALGGRCRDRHAADRGAVRATTTAKYFRALAEGHQPARRSSRQAAALAGSTPSTELIVDLARELPNFGYVKEESEPVMERMKAHVKQRPPMKGMFGASFGVGWLYEMRLGLDGVITGNGMYADVMAAMWELHKKGKADRLRDAFSRWLLMRNLNDADSRHGSCTS